MPFQSEKQRRYMHANLPDIAKRWERDYAGGGRIGFDSGTNYKTRKELIEESGLEISPSLLDYLSEKSTVGSDKYNIKFSPQAELSLSKFSEGDVDVNLKNIMYGGTTTANLGPVNIDMDITKYLDKYDVTEDDVTVAKDTQKDEQIAFSLGLDLDTLYARIDSDKDFKEFYLTLRYKFNQGGVVPAHEAGIYGLAEGGNIRLQPHTASDLLVQETSSGERPKYQPPGHVDAPAPSSPESTTGGGEPSWEGESYDPPSAPPAETVERDNGFVGGEDQEADVARMMKDMGIVDKYNAPDYGRGWVEAETDYGAGDYMGPKDKVRIHNDILARKQIWDKKKWQRDVKTTVSAFTSITNPFSMVKFVYDQNKKKKERIAEIDADLKLLDKTGATKFSPHTDTIYQQLEQEKLDLLQPKKQPEQGPDGGDGVTGVASITYDDIEDKNKKERASMRWVKEQEKVDRSKQMAYWRMMMQPYMSAQGGRVPQGYNTGGLSNLFKLKNV